MAGLSNPLPPTTGYQTTITVALLGAGDREQPTEGTFTISNSATPVAKGETEIPLSAAQAGVIMKAGQWLAFEDQTTGLLYPVKLSADYDGDDATGTPAANTELNVAALVEPIPDGAIAVFPTPFYLRQSASTDRQTNVTEFSTFDHAGIADATPGQISTTGQFDGAYSVGDTGGQTLEYAQANNLEAYIAITYPAPSSAYSRGKRQRGSFLVEGKPEDVPLEGEVSRNFSGRFTSFNVDDPVATA